MSKYRPEKVQLTLPTAYAEKFEAMLSKELGKPAKLKRTDMDEKTTFSFYPTKGEVLLIGIEVSFLAEELGGVRV